MTDLNATAREKVSKVENQRLREKGQIPAIMYGKKQDPMPIALDVKEFSKAWHEAGESTVLTIKGLGEEKSALIYDVDADPVHGTPRHVDLYVVDRTTKVEVEVPLTFEGVAPAEKELGGTMIKVLHALAIEALPKDLPHEVVVDVTGLKTFEDQIHAKDVKLPSGVTLITDAEEVVVLVQEAREEAEETEAPDMSAIEVEKKGKQEEEATE